MITLQCEDNYKRMTCLLNQNLLANNNDNTCKYVPTSSTEREASMVRTFPCFSYRSMIGLVDCRYVWILHQLNTIVEKHNCH